VRDEIAKFRAEMQTGAYRERETRERLGDVLQNIN
jgi:hypothetical protein